MQIDEFFRDKRLLDILNKYTPTDENNEIIPFGTALLNIFNNTKTNKMIVPVLGMQGMGKSTLINSILGKNILPNDADETTCVPVEVCYDEKEFAEVFYKKSKKIEIVHTCEELNAFVDNNENPGNKKMVSKIVLHDNLSMLKNGMVIVDLPGIGSLTTSNADTTTQYIKNLCTAIFVIPTTPTIRKQEVVFIKSVWSQFPTAIFVQNHWDESNRELDESVEYNSLQLKKISKEINTRYDGKIIVVNAYDALVGKLKNDNTLIASSNLLSLINELGTFSNEWDKNMKNSLLHKLFFVTITVQKIIQKHLHELGLDEEQIISERQDELNKYIEQTKEIRKKIRGVKDYLFDSEQKIKKIAKQKSEGCASSIRKDIYMLIDKGITDGQQLTDAFKNYQEEYVPKAMNEMFNELVQIKMELETILEELSDIQMDNNMSASAKEFKNGSAFKFEKIFAPGGAIAGSLGGLALGGMAYGAIATALEIEAVTLTNPITLVPGLAAIAITSIVGIIVGALGNAAKKGVTSARGEKTKKEISPYIDQIQSSVYDTITNEYYQIQSTIITILEQLDESRKQQRILLEGQVYSIYEEKSDAKLVLEDDLMYIKKVAKEMNINA